VVVADDISDITDTMNSYSQELPALGLGTSLFDGINFSRDAFLNDTNSSKHIVMLSDGSQAAPGRSNPIIAAQAASDEDIKIHTISFGADLPVMENIANETGGQSFEAVSDDQLREAFAQLLGRFRIQLVD